MSVPPRRRAARELDHLVSGAPRSSPFWHREPRVAVHECAGPGDLRGSTISLTCWQPTHGVEVVGYWGQAVSTLNRPVMCLPPPGAHWAGG